MIGEYDKCRFCKRYDEFDGCTDDFCASATKEYFEPNRDRIIEKAKEKGISVTDLISLINIE